MASASSATGSRQPRRQVSGSPTEIVNAASAAGWGWREAAPRRWSSGLRERGASRQTTRAAAAVRRADGRVARLPLLSMPRRVAVVGLVFACSLTTLVPDAVAQTTLVSNTGQSPSNVGGIGGVAFSLSDPQGARAQQFRTGSNPAGYTLSSVSFIISNWSSGNSVAVAIYSDSNGIPDSEVHSLTNPITVSLGLNTFTARAESVLDANTDYFVHIRAPTGDLVGSSTLSGAEDSESATDWSIANVSLGSIDNGANWTPASPVVRTAISGTVNAPPLWS